MGKFVAVIVAIPLAIIVIGIVAHILAILISFALFL